MRCTSTLILLVRYLRQLKAAVAISAQLCTFAASWRRPKRQHSAVTVVMQQSQCVTTRQLIHASPHFAVYADGDHSMWCNSSAYNMSLPFVGTTDIGVRNLAFVCLSL